MQEIFVISFCFVQLYFARDKFPQIISPHFYLLNHHHQIVPTNGNGGCIFIVERGKGKHPVFKSFVIDYQTGVFQVQSFLQSLRDLHNCPFGIRWALQWCVCLPSFHSLICHRFALHSSFRQMSTGHFLHAPSPSVHGSHQTTLPLANASGRYPGA